MQASINSLNQQLAEMKKQNETLYYNKELLLDQLSLQSIQLQLQTTADVHYTNTSQLAQVPVIKKLNLDNNVLAEFSNNALPDIQSVSLGILSSNISLQRPSQLRREYATSSEPAQR